MSNRATTSVATTTDLTPEELTALLQSTGWAEKASGESLARMKLDGNMLTTPDGGMYVYNPNKPTVPAMTVRIVRPPEEYWAIWIDAEAAAAIQQPSLKDTFSKNYVHPDPTRRTWPSDEVFNQLKEHGFKASWKADIFVQVVPDDGQMVGDEPVYILTLSTTSLIEFKGTSRAPSEGSVTDENFITKLSKFAMENNPGTGKTAVLDALTSLTLGGVVAEVRILRAENKELNRVWSVVSFSPVHIEPMSAGDSLALNAGNPDEVKL